MTVYAGAIYRRIDDLAFNGIGDFQFNLDLKDYQYADDVSPFAKIEALWIELFKNDGISGILVKCYNIDETAGVTRSPRDWDSADRSTVDAELNTFDMLKEIGKRYVNGSLHPN
jgi:hypothetical protein